MNDFRPSQSAFLLGWHISDAILLTEAHAQLQPQQRAKNLTISMNTRNSHKMIIVGKRCSSLTIVELKSL